MGSARLKEACFQAIRSDFEAAASSPDRYQLNLTGLTPLDAACLALEEEATMLLLKHKATSQYRDVDLERNSNACSS